MENHLLTDEEKSALCMKCQACCKYIPITLPVTPGNDQYERLIEYFQKRGCEVAKRGDYTFVRIPSKCVHLGPEGCRIYEERPEMCRLIQGDTDPGFVDICLWRFEEMKRNRKEKN